MTSNALTDARGELATELNTGGLTAYTSYPGEDAVDYPLVYVIGGLPYITYEGATFGGELVHCDVVILASNGDQPAQAKELDDQILKVLDVVRDSVEWSVDPVAGVSQPGRVAINNTSHLAVAIHCQREIHRP